MKTDLLLQEIKNLKKEVHSIRLNMVDKDMILSQDDINALQETAKEKKAGKLISLEKIQKELGCS
jgi:hypothetical protein